MKIITMARIDERLMHGIVVSQWANASGATRIMVIDDQVAHNELMKASMRIAKPGGMATSIIDLETAIANFKKGKYAAQKIFLLAKTPEVFLQLLENGVEIDKINVGLTAHKENAMKLSNRAYASEDDLKVYRQLLARNVQLTSQFVPADAEIDLATIIERGK